MPQRAKQASVAQAAEQKSVAFLGNSFIYFNNLPNTFAALAKADGHAFTVGACVRGGADLSTLLEKGAKRLL